MLLKDFSVSQLVTEESLDFGGTVDTQGEEYGITLGQCNAPTKWSCSHYSPPGTACTSSTRTCTHYTGLLEQKLIKVAA